MKVIFYCNRDESSEYEFPDDISEEELQEAADQWVSDNVFGGYEILDDDAREQYEQEMNDYMQQQMMEEEPYLF